MTDPRVEAMARAICDRHNGVWLDGDYDHDNDVWRCDATAALAASDAVDPVREAALTLIEAWDEDFNAEVRALNTLCASLGVEGTEDRIARRFASDD